MNVPLIDAARVRVYVAVLSPSCLALCLLVVAPPAAPICSSPGAPACRCFAHIRPCVQGRCGRCSRSDMILDLFFCFLLLCCLLCCLLCRLLCCLLRCLLCRLLCRLLCCLQAPARSPLGALWYHSTPPHRRCFPRQSVPTAWSNLLRQSLPGRFMCPASAGWSYQKMA